MQIKQIFYTLVFFSLVSTAHAADIVTHKRLAAATTTALFCGVSWPLGAKLLNFFVKQELLSNKQIILTGLITALPLYLYIRKSMDYIAN